MSVCCQCLTPNKDLFLLCGSLTNVTSIQKYLQSLPVCCPLTFCSSQQIRKHTSAYVWNSILLDCYLFSMYSCIENVLDVHLPKCAVYAKRAHCIPQCNALKHFQIYSLAGFVFCNFCILSHFGCRSFACTSVRRSVFDFAQGHAHVFTWVKLAERSVHSQKRNVIWIHLAVCKCPSLNKLNMIITQQFKKDCKNLVIYEYDTLMRLEIDKLDQLVLAWCWSTAGRWKNRTEFS